MYVPKYFDSMMVKIGKMHEASLEAQRSMRTCYTATFFTMFMFLVLCLGTIWIIYRLDYFKYFWRLNKFGRVHQARSCYACWRPYRRRRARTALAKGYFSEPDLDHAARTAPSPIPDIENEVEVIM